MDSIVQVEVGCKVILQEVDGSSDDIESGRLWMEEEVGRVEVADSDTEVATD